MITAAEIHQIQPLWKHEKHVILYQFHTYTRTVSYMSPEQTVWKMRDSTTRDDDNSIEISETICDQPSQAERAKTAEKKRMLRYVTLIT